MKLTIKITKEVLKESMYCASNMIGQNCAVGKAVYKLFGNNSWVFGDSIGYWLTGFNSICTPDLEMPLPDVAKVFIRQFDTSTCTERLTLPEFSFEIDVPDSVIESIGIQEAKTIIEKSSTLELALC